MDRKVLVAYFSHSGNTKRLAEIIHAQTGGVLHEISPVETYPLEYTDVVDQAKREIHQGHLPELAEEVGSVEKYDVVFIGSPNWWSTIAPPVATFLSSCTYADKTILPFCTHGGGGTGRMQNDVAQLCPRASVMSCLGVYGGGVEHAQQEIADWLRANQRF